MDVPSFDSRGGTRVLNELHSLVGRARSGVGRFDADQLSGPDARSAVEGFVELEKFAAAGKLLAIGRLDQTSAWVGDGRFRDIEAWLASISGITVGSARGTSKTARRLRALPASSDALRSGGLSPTQADAIAGAASADPNAETSLLETAKTAGVRGLKNECDRVAAAAASREAEIDQYERIRAARSLRHRRLADGTGSIEIRGPLDRTAQMMAALEPYERELFEENRTSGRREHPDAVAFDAMVRLCEQSVLARTGPERTTGSRPLAMVVVHMSKAAYERGWTDPGETCEVAGLGPIPVAVARRMASDSIFKSLVVDGVDVIRVSHHGRTIPAHLRTAVEAKDPVCTIEGCEISHHLEIDHNIPVAEGGLTELENLDRLCHHDHDRKTRHNLRRYGPPGRQRLVTKSEYARLIAEERAPPAAEAAA